MTDGQQAALAYGISVLVAWIMSTLMLIRRGELRDRTKHDIYILSLIPGINLLISISLLVMFCILAWEWYVKDDKFLNEL